MTRGLVAIAASGVPLTRPGRVTDALLATAAMFRLLHHSEILVLDGDSYRTTTKAA